MSRTAAISKLSDAITAVDCMTGLVVYRHCVVCGDEMYTDDDWNHYISSPWGFRIGSPRFYCEGCWRDCAKSQLMKICDQYDQHGRNAHDPREPSGQGREHWRNAHNPQQEGLAALPPLRAIVRNMDKKIDLLLAVVQTGLSAPNTNIQSTL
jgi:hypothetical protein